MRSNDSDPELGRRTVLKTAGVVAVGTLAGCTGSSATGGSTPDAGGDSGGSGGSSGGSSGGTTGDGSGTEATLTATTSPSSSSTSFGGWFDGVANFDGTVVDATDQSEVEVTVGAQGNGGNFAFDPAAIRVAPGTAVVWTWTGAGGAHNVVAEDGTFESELVAEEGHSFSYTFDEPGTVTYACTPHRSIGMRGAVVVE